MGDQKEDIQWLGDIHRVGCLCKGVHLQVLLFYLSSAPFTGNRANVIYNGLTMLPDESSHKASNKTDSKCY